MEIEHRNISRQSPYRWNFHSTFSPTRFTIHRRSFDVADRSQGAKSAEDGSPSPTSFRDRAESFTVGFLYSFRRKTNRRQSAFHAESEMVNELKSQFESPENDKRHNRSNHLKVHLEKRKRLLAKFRLITKMTIFCKRLALAHCIKSSQNDNMAPFLSGVNFHDADTDDASDLLFDPRKFKADKEAQVVLRNNPCFAEYPVRMQRNISKAAHYERFEARRVIVRQGHRAAAFYFILSGSVVVMVCDPETKMTKPVAFMHRDMAFGELAIINRTIRQATIVAKESVELLSIDIEDFHKIFMLGGVKNINDPDHLQFLGNLDFLKGWPIEVMAENPEKCIFHYFKSGETLVKDSNFSDWVFIVKSGSIKVLKKLKRVSPKLNKILNKKPASKWKSKKQLREDRELRDQQRRYILPDIHIPTETPGDDQVQQVLQLPNLTLSNSGYISQGVYQSPRANITENSVKKNSQVRQGQRKTEANCGKNSETREECVQADGNLDANDVTTKTDHLNDSSLSVESRNQIRHEVKPPHVKTHKLNSRTSKPRLDMASKTPQEVKSNQKLSRKDQVAAEEEEELGGRQQHIRTITQDLDAKFNSKDPDDVTEADLDPQFVHVQTLTKGQVFGLAETILGKQPSFCIVSNGAECVMIDKNFYLQHATDDLTRRMRQALCPYPSDEAMQACLQVSVDWEEYKSQTFRDTVKHLGSSPRRYCQS